MKTTSKLLAMLLIVVMCMSLFGGLSAFADTMAVSAEQVDPTPADAGTVSFQLFPVSDVIEIASVAWNCGGSMYDCSTYSYDPSSGMLYVTGTDWSVVTDTQISLVGGDPVMAVAPGTPGSCTVTYTPAPDPVPFNVTQRDASGMAYSFDSSKDNGVSFRYTLTGNLGSVSIDGSDITNLCSVSLGSNMISVPASAVIAYGSSNKATHELNFVSADGLNTLVFTIVDTKKYTSEDPYNNGKDQAPTIEYLKGSGTTVRFNTTANPLDVKVYDRTSGNYVSGINYTYGSTVYGTGITFDNASLDSLTAGRTYEIWCVYGDAAGQGVQVGFLKVGNRSASDPRYEGRLYFTNGNVSTTETKWVSGSIKPEMFCDLFLIDGAYLQVSSNGGQSWRDVGINDYLIKNDSSDHRTAYAYFGDKYLNSLAGDSMYYYRVYVPAGKIDTTEVHSNAIIITTGATLSYIDTDKHVINSTKNLRFKSSAPIDKVYVGSIELTDPNYFSLSNDKKTVTLSPEFLNSRTAGNTYTLSVLTKDGEKLSTTFQILTPGQAASSPKTGDESQIALWAAFVLVSGAAIAVVAPKLRKNED